jgi:putative FmdB family regulatory protein
MPTYTYECAAGVEFEREQRITEAPLKTCPVCEKCTPKRLITGAPGVHLISGDAGGWSSTGYSKAPHERRAEQILGRKLVKAAR